MIGNGGLQIANFTYPEILWKLTDKPKQTQFEGDDNLNGTGKH